MRQPSVGTIVVDCILAVTGALILGADTMFFVVACVACDYGSAVLLAISFVFTAFVVARTMGRLDEYARSTRP